MKMVYNCPKNRPDMGTFLGAPRVDFVPLPLTSIQPYDSMSIDYKFQHSLITVPDGSTIGTGTLNWQPPLVDPTVDRIPGKRDLFDVIDDCKTLFPGLFKPLKVTGIKDYKQEKILLEDIEIGNDLNDNGKREILSSEGPDSNLKNSADSPSVLVLNSKSKLKLPLNVTVSSSSANNSPLLNPNSANPSPSNEKKQPEKVLPKTPSDWQKLAKYFKMKRDDEKIRKKPEWIAFYNCAIYICFFSELSVIENGKEYVERWDSQEQKILEYTSYCKRHKFVELVTLMYDELILVISVLDTLG